MASDGDNLDRGIAEQPDVDAAWVVAIDQHHVTVALIEQLDVHPDQRRSILGLHHA
jgi:hypothetical protein